MRRVTIDRQNFAGAFTAVAILVGALGGIAQSRAGSGWIEILWARITHRHTVADRLDQYGDDVAARLASHFAAANVPYPPTELALVAFKDAHRLELYARAKPDDTWRSIRGYPVLALSGALGPKLRAGDRQVPEGVYAVESLNPNSRFHLAIRVGYPNAEDQDAALADGRTRLGSDIMIHGAAASIGCLAMGDRAAEELFVLTALAGPKNVRIIISPVDFRVPSTPAPPTDVKWIQERYRKLATELAQFPRTP